MAATTELRAELAGLLELLKRDTDTLERLLKTLDTEVSQPDAERPEEDAWFADRKAFLAMKQSLLAKYGGMWVAFANGRLIAASHSFDELMKSTAAVDPAVDLYVEQVKEEAFLEPPPFDADGVHEVYEDTGGLP